MGSIRKHNLNDVENYVRNVSAVSGMNLSEVRLKPHFPEFLRLLNDIEDLNDVVTDTRLLHVGPVTTYTHDKNSLDSKRG